jgi:hypothetical protein
MLDHILLIERKEGKKNIPISKMLHPLYKWGHSCQLHPQIIQSLLLFYYIKPYTGIYIQVVSLRLQRK